VLKSDLCYCECYRLKGRDIQVEVWTEGLMNTNEEIELQVLWSFFMV